MKSVSKILTLIIMTCLLVFAPFSVAYATAESQLGDMVKLNGDVYVNEGTTVNGNVVAIFGDAYVNGTVTGDVVSIFGDINVNSGKVMGDAVSVTGKITVGENGKVMGDTVEALGVRINTNGQRNHNYNFDFKPNINIPAWGIGAAGIFISLIGTMVLYGIAVLIYLIMHNHIEKMAATIEPNIGKRIGIGFLTLIGSPIALIIVSIVLAITIIGIIVIPFVWIAFALAVLVALVPIYVYIGRKTGTLFTKSRISGYVAIAIAMLVFWLANTLLSFGGPFTGWISAIISIGTFVLGTGTILDYLFSNRKPKKYAPYPPNYPEGAGQRPYYGGPAEKPEVQNNENYDNNIPKDDNK